MKKEFVGAALLWLGTNTGIIRKKGVEEKAAFEDGVISEANAQIVGEIPFKGSAISGKLLALREQRGGGAKVHDAALLARTVRGESIGSESDVPLGTTEREN
ncbi:hypothetical protein K2P56_00240 [Patescibacteria group bacterium]|nr:hypothetical protein [Patescibacteria group bacterium]